MATTATVSYDYRVPGELRHGAIGRYGYDELRVDVTYDIEPGETPDEVVAENIAAVKKLVLDALGVEYAAEYAPDGSERVIVLLEESFPGIERVDQPAATTQTTYTQTPQGGNLTVKVLKPLNDDHPAWLEAQWQKLVSSGKTTADDNELWDNRKFLPQFGGSGNAKGPWYKTKSGQQPIWPPR